MSNCINVPRIFFFAYLKKKNCYRMWKYICYVMLIFYAYLDIYSNFNSFVSVNIFDIAFYSV